MIAGVFDSWVILGRPKMCPSRLKLTMTVMSIGLARDKGGGFQQPRSLTTTSLMVSICPVSARAGAIHARQQQESPQTRGPVCRAVSPSIT